MTIEEAINEAAENGRLSITLFPSSAGGYQANLSFDNRKSWRVEMSSNPADALKKVLGLIPGAAGEMRPEPENDGGVFG
jgi:hypothetical protein